MLSDHAGYFVQGDIIKHTYMALGVELGKNFAKVHCQIMINNVGEAVSKFLNTDLRAFFHATNRPEHQKQMSQLWHAVTSLTS